MTAATEAWSQEHATYTYDDTNEVVSVTDASNLYVPLTVEAITAGKIKISNPLKKTIKYSKNDAAKTESKANPIEIAVVAGDKVQLYGNNAVYYDSKTDKCTAIGGSGKGFECKVYGNIMSLIDENNFAQATTLTKAFAFRQLFYSNQALTDASNLLLPATTLTTGCYRSMFMNCFNLIAAPDLPAENLTNTCYTGMFSGCFSLTTAPKLPAGLLTSSCYSSMFDGCSKLDTVTCLATDIEAYNSTHAWLKKVAETGTFTKANDMTDWPEGESGIPDGWTREDYMTPVGYTSIANATVSDQGKLICTAGHIHAYNGDAECTETRVALILYVGSQTGNPTYNHGLALALADEGSMKWSAAISACSAKNSSAPVTGASWMLADIEQWITMINAAGSYITLREIFSSVGGTNLKPASYWSCKELGSNHAWFYAFQDGMGMWGDAKAKKVYEVRSALAF